MRFEREQRPKERDEKNTQMQQVEINLKGKALRLAIIEKEALAKQHGLKNFQ